MASSAAEKEAAFVADARAAAVDMLGLLEKGDGGAALIKYAFGSEAAVPGGDIQNFIVAGGAFDTEVKPVLINALKYTVKPGVRTAVIECEGGSDHSHAVFFYIDDDFVAVMGEDKKKDHKWKKMIGDGKWMLSNTA